jgi:hypothetical protein
VGDRAYEETYFTWKSLIRTEDESATPKIEKAEKTLLKHRPATFRDAIILLDVIGEGLAFGPRTDGLDLKALNNLKSWAKTGASEPDDYTRIARLSA